METTNHTHPLSAGRIAVLAAAVSAGAIAAASTPCSAGTYIPTAQWTGNSYSSGSGVWANTAGADSAYAPIGYSYAPTTDTTTFANGNVGVDTMGASAFSTIGSANYTSLLSGSTAMTLVAVFNPLAASSNINGDFWENDGLIGGEGTQESFGLGYGSPQAGTGTELMAGIGANSTDVTSGGKNYGTTSSIFSAPLNLGQTYVGVMTWQATGAATASGSQLSLYLDGNLVGSTDPYATQPRNNTSIQLGAMGQGGGGTGVMATSMQDVFPGVIGDLQVYAGNALTSTQVSNLSGSLLSQYYLSPSGPATPSPAGTPDHFYNFATAPSTAALGTVADTGTSASSATAGTLTGTAITQAGVGMLTNGTDTTAGLSMPAANFSSYTGSFTIEDWFNRADMAENYQSLFAFSYGNTHSGQGYIKAAAQRAGNDLFMSVGMHNADTAKDPIVQLNARAAQPGQETMLALTYNSANSEASIYVDGTLQGTEVVGGGFNLSQYTNDVVSGQNPYNNSSLNGSTTQFATYDNALTGGQVLSAWQTGPAQSPPITAQTSSGLVAAYDFSNGSANNLVGSGAGTLNGDATLGVGGLVTHSGTNETPDETNNLALPNSTVSSITSGFTLEDWFVSNNQGYGFSDPTFQTLFWFGSATGSRLKMTDPPGQSGQLQVGLTAPGVNHLDLYGYAPAIGAKTLVTVVYDASTNTMYLYENGQMVNSVQVTFPSTSKLTSLNLASIVGSSLPTLGGGSLYPNPGFDGTTLGFRLYGTDLNSSQVLYDFQQGPSAPVPEPAALAILTLGGVGLLLRKRRKPAS